MSDVQEYLNDMLDYTKTIADFTVDGREAFINDRKTQFAVIRAYEVIGEIAKRLPEDLLEAQGHIEWKQIKAFRDFLAHNYERIRPDAVWNAVEKLPELRIAIEAIIQQLSQENDE
jgi:uncharacterized protein with HEPN domain